MKKWLFVFAAAAIAATGLFVKREPLMLAWIARSIDPVTLEDQRALLAPAIEIIIPETGEGPFPVVLQFHGCAGPRMDFHRGWARAANEAGFAAMIVNSNGPRGYYYEKALETVCEGTALLGVERAADIAAAISLARQDDRLDAERIVLAGWSHGGWTVMDYLTMDFENTFPPSLKDEAFQPPKLEGVILFYPHCGLGALSRFQPWRQKTDILAFVGMQDSVVNADQCVDMLEKRKSTDSVDLVIYPDAEHIFDDATIRDRFPEYYNEAAAKDAAGRFKDFLAARQNGQ